MPLSIDQLDGLYDSTPPPAATPPKPIPQQVPPDGGKKEAATPAPQSSQDILDQVMSGSNKSASSVKGGEVHNEDISEYLPYMNQGVYTDRKDIDLQRGEDQSFGEKLFRKVGNIVPNMAASTLDMLGYTGAALDQWGDNRDYDNWLTRAATAIRDPFGEAYASNDHSTLGKTLSDPSWWLDQAVGAVELLAPYAGAGSLIGKAFEAGADGFAALTRLGAEGRAVAQGAAQLGTSGMISYFMGASGGARVYQDTYNTQLQKGIDQGMDPDSAHERARHIAAQSAATTVQLSTTLGAALNMGAMGVYFRDSNAVYRDILAKESEQLPGESMSAWEDRVKNLNPADYRDKLVEGTGWGHKLASMGKMGAEMTNLQFAEKTGEDLGKSGKEKGYLQQFGEIENLFDRMGNKDGLLTFAMGAISGLGIDYVMHNAIPSRLIDRVGTDGQPMQATVKGDDGQEMPKFDKDGTPVFQKQWVTPRKADEWGVDQRFTSMRDAVASDITNFKEANQRYAAAVKSGNPIEVDKAAGELFNTSNLYAIKQGFGEQWKNTYNNIGALDNKTPGEDGLTDAQRAGYSSGVGDDAYQEKATKAAADIDRYSKIYDGLKKRYGADYDSNAAVAQVVDMMFNRKVHLDAWDDAIKKHEQLLRQGEDQEKDLTATLNPDYDSTIDDHAGKMDAARNTAQQLEREMATLKKASEDGDIATMKRMVRKYQGVGVNDSDLPNAVPNMINKIKTKHGEATEEAQQHESAILDSTNYEEWAKNKDNPDFNSFLAEHATKTRQGLMNDVLRRQISQARAEHDVATANYNDVLKEKNITRFTKKAADWMENLRKEQERVNKDHTASFSARAKDMANLSVLERQQMNDTADKLEAAHQESLTRIQQLNERFERVDKAHKEQSLWKDPVKKWNLANERSAIAREIKAEQARANYLKEQALAHRVSMDYPKGDIGATTLAPTEVDTQQPVTAPEATAEDQEVNEQEVGEELDNQTPEEIAQDTATAVTPTPVSSPEPTGPPVDEAEAIMAEWLKNAPTIEEVEAEGPPAVVNGYLKAMRATHPEVQDKLLEVQRALENGTAAFSLDALKAEVAKGLITQADAAKILLNLRDMIDTLAQKEAEGDIDSYEQGLAPAEVAVVSQAPRVDSEGPGIPDSPEISNGDEEAFKFTDFNNNITGDLSRHAGLKAVDMQKIASTTFAQTQDVFDPKKNAWVKVSDVTKLNPELNQDILKSDKLLPGTTLRLEVDKSYQGMADYNNQPTEDEYGMKIQREESISEYLDASGKVKTTPEHVGNIPIRIMDAVTGRKLGYVHKMDWINAKFPDTIDYRNIVDTILDKDGNEVDNLAMQNAKIMQLRQAVVDAHNAGRGGIDARTTDKGVGQLIMNRNFNVNTGKSTIKPGFARGRDESKSLLPDQSLKLGIVDQGGVIFDSYQHEFSGPRAYSNDDVNLPKGSVVVFLPGANGLHTFSPLIGERLVSADGKRVSSVKTVARAIELYLSHDGTKPEIGEEIARLEKNTGFNIADHRQLKNFINQYFTYTRSFKQTDLSPNSPAKGSRKESFEFNIWDPIGAQTKGDIGLGWTFSGKPMVRAQLVNGKLDPTFVQELTKGFQTRSRAVVYNDPFQRSTRGINESTMEGNPFRDAVYTGDGKWRHQEYPNYNEYVKSFSKTAVYGRNKLDDGKYTYAANPSIPFEVPTNRGYPEADQTPARGTTPAGQTITYKEQEKGPVDDVDKRIKLSALMRVSESSRVRGTSRNEQMATLREIQDIVKNPEFDSTVNYMDYLHNNMDALADRQQEHLGMLENLAEVSKAWKALGLKWDGERGFHNAYNKILDEVENRYLNKKSGDATPPTSIEPPAFDGLAAMDWDNLTNFSIHMDPPAVTGKELGTTTENAQPLTVEALEKLYNFTPEAERNGKTPMEVYKELIHNGHTFLPEGFFPFTRCL